jgi:trigger factor
LNIQTERLENHTARFTVEIETERLEAAKKVAAKKIARQVRIPGFRKGKAPYRVLVNHVGEAAILEEAIEDLGNQVYRDALDDSDVEPYGPGSLEDFQVEPQPTFKFVVPLQPTADLGNYREIRADFEPTVIEDSQVDETLKALQEREAVIEESAKPVAAGNRVTVSIRAETVETDENDADAEDGEDGEAEESASPDDDNVFLDNEELVFTLTEDREPVPGFTDALVGAAVDEKREFELVYPEDEEEYGTLSGKPVKFAVTIKKIESMTVPELTDDFAARVSQSPQSGKVDEDSEPLTLLQLRMRIREDLQKEADERVKAEYAQTVLDKIVEQATFAYPEALVDDQIHHLLNHLDSDLRQRGLTLDDYMKVTNKTHEDLHEDYHDNAVETVRRSLVLRELTEAESIEVTDADLDAEIDKVVAQFGEQAAAFRSIYNNPNMRSNLQSDLLNRKVMDRIVSIAKGEEPAAKVAEETTEVVVPDEVESLEAENSEEEAD